MQSFAGDFISLGTSVWGVLHAVKDKISVLQPNSSLLLDNLRSIDGVSRRERLCSTVIQSPELEEDHWGIDTRQE